VFFCEAKKSQSILAKKEKETAKVSNVEAF
jgi:hypothetical protein